MPFPVREATGLQVGVVVHGAAMRPVKEAAEKKPEPAVRSLVATAAEEGVS